jgi:hypothetical protein
MGRISGKLDDSTEISYTIPIAVPLNMLYTFQMNKT